MIRLANTNKGLTALIVAALLATSPVGAQQPPDAGDLLRQQQQTSPQALPPFLAPDTPQPRPALRETRGPKVMVRQIRFSGAEGLIEEAALHAEVADAINQELDIGQLHQLAERITQLLKSRGWFLARAYLPQQDVTEGNIEIAILQGKIEGGANGDGIVLALEDNVRLKPERIRGVITKALFHQGESAINESRLERGMLLLNDLPGIQASSNLERGNVPGTTRFSLAVSEQEPWSGSLQYDNHGNRFTGEHRLTGQATWANPSGAGDLVNASLAWASDLALLMAAYQRPLGYQGLDISLTTTALAYQIGQELAALDNKGTANTLSMGAGYPFLRSRTANLRGQIGGEYKILKDESLGEVIKHRHVMVLNMGFSGDSQDAWLGGGLINYSGTLTMGDADYSRVAADREADQPAGTEGHFVKAAINLVRLQKIDAQTSLYAALNGQWANKNLPSSEKFSLGGPVGIRAYPGGEGSGDAGIQFSLELRRELPNLHSGASTQLLGFVDAGHITMNHSPWEGSVGNATNSNSYELYGAGGGINYSVIGRYSLRGLWSHQLGDNAGRAPETDYNGDGKKGRHRFWVTAMLWF